MIKIFKSNSKKETSKKKLAEQAYSSEELGKEKLSKLHPMVIPMLAVKLQENNKNDFLISSRDTILNRPHRLTDNWIQSLNKWVDSLIEAATLDEPDIKIGQRHELGPFVIDTIKQVHDEYGTPALICKDSSGWKWYLRTSKAYNFNIGDNIKFVAMVVSHKDGITFLSRPTKIELIKKAEDTEKT